MDLLALFIPPQGAGTNLPGKTSQWSTGQVDWGTRSRLGNPEGYLDIEVTVQL